MYCFNQQNWPEPLNVCQSPATGGLRFFDSVGDDTAGAKNFWATSTFARLCAQMARAAPLQIASSVVGGGRDREFFEFEYSRPRVWYYKTQKAPTS